MLTKNLWSYSRTRCIWYSFQSFHSRKLDYYPGDHRWCFYAPRGYNWIWWLRIRLEIWCMINFFKIGKNAASVSYEIYHTVHWRFIILSAYTAFCVRHFSTVAISKPTRSSISLSAVPFWLSFRAISFAFFTSPCSKPSAYWEASFCPGLKPFLLSQLSQWLSLAQAA